MMRDVIIIGGGAAGCSAGIYAARKKMNAMLIAKDFIGQTGVSTCVENYVGFEKISGIHLAQKFKEHLKCFHLDVQSFEEVLIINKIEKGFEIKTDEGIYQTRSIIIATGSIPKKLHAKNEENFLGKGISYCVTCDETSFEGKDVAVIGAGNAGLEAAIELTRFAKKVYVLEWLERSKADAVLLDEVNKNPKIEMIFSAHVTSFEGDETLQKIIFEQKTIAAEQTIDVQGCFIEIGYKPYTNFCSHIVTCNSLGEIQVNPRTMETSCPGIFAAGDVTDFQDKQIIIAAGQGASAALSDFRYITSLS